VNVDAVWHDLECADYREDLPLWRSLAVEAGGPVLDIGAGTGRVTLDLAGRGVETVALDTDARLLEALAVRGRGLPVETAVADARNFSLGRRFSLILVPMQTLQLLGGGSGRAAFLRRALAHLAPGGVLAAAVADAMDCFDEQHDAPPPPQVCDILGVRYSSQLLAAVERDGRAVLSRRREIIGAAGRRDVCEVLVRLDRVTADQVAAEASALGFLNEPHLLVPETEQYLPSAVVVARAPGAHAYTPAEPSSTSRAGSKPATGSWV
jgi:SAM-dependent methyltransferase